MIDVNGVYFEPRQKVTELKHTAIYECKKGNRYVVKLDRRNQAMIKLDQAQAESGMSLREFTRHYGIPTSSYGYWKGKGRVPNTELGLKALISVFDISEETAVEMIES